MGAQIETSVVSYLLELVDEADRNKDGKIDFDEWETMSDFLFLLLFRWC
jgi:NADH dehydrogenase